MAETNLSAQDLRLLGLIREGCVDAEIAVRLGTTTAAVKERVTALIDALGVRGRIELADGVFDDVAEGPATEFAPSEIETRASGGAKLRRGAAFVVGIAAGVVLMTLLGQFVAPREETAVEGHLPAHGDARNTTVDSSAALVMRAGAPMFDTGQLFTGPFSAEQRGETTLVRMSAGAALLLDAGEGGPWTATGTRAFPAGVSLSGLVDGRMVVVHVLAADGSTSVVLAPEGVRVSAFGRSAPNVLVWVDGFTSEVGEDGHLYIGAEQSAASLVAYDTGEQFASESLAELAATTDDSAWFGTFCGEGEACYVVAKLGTLEPAGCAFEEMDRGYRLQFSSIERTSPTCAGSRFRISAVSDDGRPVSVLADGRGVLYAGPVSPNFACPCRSGS